MGSQKNDGGEIVLRLTIPGEPMGKQRPRHGNGFTYTPQKTVNYETLVKELFTISGQKKLGHELWVDIKAYFPIPKSTSKTKAEQMRREIIRPTKKPDTDNIAKIILDALNKLAYDDDSQVIDLRVQKYYSDNPRVEIVINEV